MEVYRPHDPHHALLIAQWFTFMEENGDNALMFVTPHTLATLFDTVRPPTVLLFEADDSGIWYVAWFEPTYYGAFFSTWARADHRKSKQAYRAFLQAAWAGFQTYRCLLGLTKRPDLLDVHKHVGYTELCEVPGLFGDTPAYLMWLDKETIRGRVSRWNQRGIGEPIQPVEPVVRSDQT